MGMRFRDYAGARFGDAKVGTRFGGVSNRPSPHICLSREPSQRMVGLILPRILGPVS